MQLDCDTRIGRIQKRAHDLSINRIEWNLEEQLELWNEDH